MPEMSVEFDVYCSCGNGLCNQTEVKAPDRGFLWTVTIVPCEVCLDDAKEEGHSAGFDEGYDKGKDDVS